MRFSRRSVFLFAVAAMTFTAGTESAKKVQTGFLDRTVAVAGTEYKYQVFIPDQWTPARKWPVILFLYGAGERGEDGLLQTQVGIGRAIRLDRSRFPFTGAAAGIAAAGTAFAGHVPSVSSSFFRISPALKSPATARIVFPGA